MCPFQSLTFFDGPCDFNIWCLCSNPGILQAGHTIGFTLRCIQDCTVQGIRNGLILTHFQIIACPNTFQCDLIITIAAIEIQICNRQIFIRYGCFLQLAKTICTIRIYSQCAVCCRCAVQICHVIIVILCQIFCF